MLFDDSSKEDVVPLALQDDFSLLNKNLQDDLSRQIFETEAEYIERIKTMKPVQIGHATLDMRRKDTYNNNIFLIHHLEPQEQINFSPIAAFYLDASLAKNLETGELLARLKVYQGKLYCDYGQVYLHSENKFVLLQVIAWHKFIYETEAEYKARIENLPCLPLGMAMPLVQNYSAANQTLPFLCKPFCYMEPLLASARGQKQCIMENCDRKSLKKICQADKPFLLFGKLNSSLNFVSYFLWQENLGKLYQEDLTKNDEQHFVWLADRAKADKVEAQYQLGECYAKGYGIKQNYHKAVFWYKKAAEKGHLAAQQKLIHLQEILGDSYYYGVGAAQDYAEAVKWYRQAAEAGYDWAEYSLGDCYANGQGVEQEDSQAVFWYEKAANKGNTWAQYKLGLCYENGKGTTQNMKNAIKWYQRASERGNAYAQKKLGDYYSSGKFVTQDFSQAVFWYQQAAEQGNVLAQKCLGDCFAAAGTGVEPDIERAMFWYHRSANQGNDEALAKLTELQEQCEANAEEE